MSCERCCYNPCDCTAKCPDGTYFVKDTYGNITVLVELPEELKIVIMRVLDKVLFGER